MDTPSVETSILDIAQTLTQTRGYNAFSYRDISEVIGIKTSSIHYYFPTKGDLGEALVRRYRNNFKSALSLIDEQGGDPLKRLKLYMDLFKKTLQIENKICLCGMLAADFTTLPGAIQKQVQSFFSDNELWLAKTLQEGKAQGHFHLYASAETVAKIFLDTLEGAMMAARSFSDVKRFTNTTQWLLKSVAYKD